MAWDDLRYFLAVARAGTFSAAARVLRVAQPTVGRRIEALEQRLGARLFERTPRGLVPTATGQRIRESVESMEAAALGIERSAIGVDDGLRGSVRITASEWLAVRVLPAALAPVLESNPGLACELVADARHLNLARREADLALRPRPFDQATVYQRRVGRIELALYGAPGATFTPGCPMIAMADDVGDIARSWLATHAKHARIVARTNGREPMARLAAAGVGIACLPRVLGDTTPGLHVVDAPPIPGRPLWLGVHRDMRAVPRVRAVIATLAAAIPALL